MMEQEKAIFKSKDQFRELTNELQEAAKRGDSIDHIEKELWHELLNLGRLMMQEYVDQQGSGDLGPTLNDEGKTLRRLDTLYEKRYVSVFGEISILRTVYGTRESQKHEVVPLDIRLNLPESDFSFLLQDWSQTFCVQGSYKQSGQTIERILRIGQSVRSLEHMNSAMAQDVEAFRDSQPAAAAEEEGSILVLTADGKGVPMRRDTPPKEFESGGRRKKGPESVIKNPLILV